MQRLITFFIIIGLLLSASGCAVLDLYDEEELDEYLKQTEDSPLEEDEPNNQESNNQEPRNGGYLKYAIKSPDSLNPYASNSADYLNLTGLIFDSLFTYDENLSYIPFLVEGWSISDEGRLWHIKLKEGIKWHDGSELTAEDVKYSIDIILAEINNYKEILAEIEDIKREEREKRDKRNRRWGWLNRDQEEDFDIDIELPDLSYYARRLYENVSLERTDFVLNDPYSIDLTFLEPTGVLLMGFLDFPILKDKSLDEEEEISIRNLVGTGPYKIDSGSLDTGSSLLLVKNEDWWSEEKPYLSGFIFKSYEDKEKSLEAYKRGEVDMVDSRMVYADSYNWEENSRSYNYLTTNFYYLGINHHRESLINDLRIRQAIAYGMDRQDIILNVFQNNAQVVDTPYPPDVWYGNPDIRVYDHQPQTSSKLLEDLGFWSKDGQTYRYKIQDTGHGIMDLSFDVLVDRDNNEHKEILYFLKDQLAELGIELVPVLIGNDEFDKTLDEGNYDMVFREVRQDVNLNLINFEDDLNIYKPKLDFDNLEEYDEIVDFDDEETSEEKLLDEIIEASLSAEGKKLDKLLKDISTADSLDKFGDKQQDIQNYIVEELPIISLFYKTSSILAVDNIRGIKNSRELMLYRNVDQWHMRKP